MLSFDHPNVMTVIGLCLDTAAPLIIMPFMSNGSVLDYLKCHRKELHIENKVDDVKVSNYNDEYNDDANLSYTSIDEVSPNIFVGNMSPDS